MKILIPIFGGFGKTGGFRVLSELANHFIELGAEVTFLSFYKAEIPYFPTQAQLKFYNYQGEIVNAYKSESYSFHYFTMMFGLRKAINRLAPFDIILANHNATAFPVKFSRQKAKKFYYIQAYEPEYYPLNSFKHVVLKVISKTSYYLGLNTMVNSDLYRNYKGIKSNKVIYPGVNFEIFKPISDATFQKKKPLVLGTVYREEEHKGSKYILDAFEKLQYIYSDQIKLRLAFGNENLLKDGIELVHCDGDQNLADFYNSLDVYISAGTVQFEAIHYPVLEAMACKILLVTTGYKPSNELNSIRIIPKNADSIVHAIRSIMDLKTNEELQHFIENGYEAVKSFGMREQATKMYRYFTDN